TLTTARDAAVDVVPSATPLRGESVVYDPTVSASLQALPVGAETTDTFYYSIIDIGQGDITAYSGTAATSPVQVTSPDHRLEDGTEILISGSDTDDYNGVHTVTVIDEDTFSIEVDFVDDPPEKGQWVTTGPRTPSAVSDG